MGKLDSRVAVVTGSGQGIGKAIALAFAREGADLCIADKIFVNAETTADEIRSIGRRSSAVEVDVIKLADLNKMVMTTIDHFGKIDILVNNAGIYYPRPILEVTENDWDTIMDVNLKGLFFTTQRVLPYMFQQGKGKVINLASLSAVKGHKNLTVYCASKGGVLNLTRALAIELAPMKINVNGIAPGMTMTPTIRSQLDAYPDMLQSLIEEIPLGRPARLEEIATAAVYLASDESDFITGHTMFLDGGNDKPLEQ